MGRSEVRTAMEVGAGQSSQGTFFDGQKAERYDAEHAGMFDAAIVDPVVSFLSDLAGGQARSSPGSVPAASRRRSAATHLETDDCLVVEVEVPQL